MRQSQIVTKHIGWLETILAEQDSASRRDAVQEGIDALKMNRMANQEYEIGQYGDGDYDPV